MTIPASNIVTTNPGVIGGGGSALALNGVILSENALIPAGKVISFGSADAVSTFFGPSSTEYVLAQNYFLGFDNSTQKPGTLMFAPYHADAVGAWLQSGSLATLTLAELKALSGTLIVTVDGVTFTSSTINFSSITSYSDAATAIAAAFTGTGKPTCAWNSVNSTFTLSSTTTGESSTITAATGTLSASLNLTLATGATVSQGADADTPPIAMDMVKAATQNWVSFTTMWEPLIADKEAFAAWQTAQNNRYAYICWDTDAQAIAQGSTSAFGYVCAQNSYSATNVISGSAANVIDEGTTLAVLLPKVAAFVLGMIASIDMTRTNGRITPAFKSQSGLTATVTDEQTSKNLLANGYSYYGAYAEASNQWTFFYNGQLPGSKWKWLDTFINQVYLNSQFRVALMSYATTVNAIPYNQDGYSDIKLVMQDPINQGLNAGIIRKGVTLSNAQKVEINTAAGLDISGPLQQAGYYVQVLDPGAQARANRQTPIINFWYMDGGAVQSFSIASIAVL